MTQPDFIYETYNQLLELDWRMAEIDECDLLGLLRVRAWAAKHKYRREHPAPKKICIDEVWPGLKPVRW